MLFSIVIIKNVFQKKKEDLYVFMLYCEVAFVSKLRLKQNLIRLTVRCQLEIMLDTGCIHTI